MHFQFKTTIPNLDEDELFDIWRKCNLNMRIE